MDKEDEDSDKEAELEEEVDFSDMKNLKEYFDFHEKLPKQIRDQEVKHAEGILSDRESSLDEQKISIMVLAHAGTKKALRILEKYTVDCNQELDFWFHTATGECQMFINSTKTP